MATVCRVLQNINSNIGGNKLQPTKKNHKVWTEAKEDLVNFLNEQFDKMPEDWDIHDHIFLVLETSISHSIQNGNQKNGVRAEVEAVLNTINTKKKLN
jgi:hypothetical protein